MQKGCIKMNYAGGGGGGGGGGELKVYIWFFIHQQGLLQELVNNIDGQLKSEVTQMAAFYEHRLQLGQKAIYHLEAFIAKFMSIYKRFLEQDMADFF